MRRPGGRVHLRRARLCRGAARRTGRYRHPENARRAARAIVRGGRASSLTFAELEREVATAAAWLESLGLRKGMAALVFVPMSAELYVALLAMFRLGAVALFLDPSAGRAHIERCCARWPPDLF